MLSRLGMAPYRLSFLPFPGLAFCIWRWALADWADWKRTTYALARTPILVVWSSWSLRTVPYRPILALSLVIPRSIALAVSGGFQDGGHWSHILVIDS